MRGARTILPGLNRPSGSKLSLTSSKARTRRGPEHRLVELRAHQAVAVLARVGALVLAHHRERLLRDRAHLAHVPLVLEVEDRAHVQAADRGVRVPGAAGAVAGEEVGEALGVVGQMLERHGAVLDERDRLAVALHRHHDVEPGLAQLPDPALLRRARRPRPRRRAGRDRAISSPRRRRPRSCSLQLVARELDQQQRVGRAADERSPASGRKAGIVAGELEDRAVDQLDRGGPEVDDVPGRVHRGVEAREVADAQHLVGGQRLQLELERR